MGSEWRGGMDGGGGDVVWMMGCGGGRVGSGWRRSGGVEGVLGGSG